MRIEILEGPRNKGQAYTFGDDEGVVIGRGTSCQLTLADPEASRSHAKIVLRDGAPHLLDLGSKNGTNLNGAGITEAALANHDRILIGNTLLEITDLPDVEPGTSSQLQLVDDEQSVLVTINHRDADMIVGRKTTESLDEVSRENDVLREICRISQVLAAKDAAQNILQLILEQMHEVLAADTVCILSRASEDEEWSVRASVGDVSRDGVLNVSRTIINQALTDGTAILSTDPLSDERFDASKSIISQGVSSALCTPLLVGDAFGGVLFLDRRSKRRAFEQMDLRMTATVGNLLGIFLEKEQYEIEMQKKARLAVIGEVVAGLAHYIKNIITGFNLSISNLELAFERKKFDWVDPCIRTISSMERRISDLMLNMLSYAKDRKPCPEMTDVQKLMDDLAAPYEKQLADDGITYEAVRHPDVTEVYAEERSLFRVFLNLFLNSMDAVRSKKEGEKRIRFSADPGPDGDGVEFRFRDTGGGIPKDKLDQIFAAFFSTKGSRGTGLGLAVVHKIVQEHEGEISVDSEEGAWTEFRILLPPPPVQPETEA